MYKYEKEKDVVCSEKGQRMFLQIRDRVQTLLAEAGAVSMQCAVGGTSGDSWAMVACVDRLVELGEITEISRPTTPGQYRVFVAIGH